MHSKKYLITLAAALGALAAMPTTATAETKKNDPVMIKLQGQGDAIEVFKHSAEAAGGTVAYAGRRSAIAAFGARLAGASITAKGGGSYVLYVAADPEKNPDDEDDVAAIETAITDGLNKAGFTVREWRRGD